MKNNNRKEAVSLVEVRQPQSLFILIKYFTKRFHPLKSHKGFLDFILIPNKKTE